jgi:predicted dehydrogenase
MSLSSKIRTAVVGVGYLGKFHAEKYATLEDANLTAVVDVDLEKAEKTASVLGTKAYACHREILDLVDAVSISVPTYAHFEVARDFLEKGVHILLEKPITTTLEEADELIAIARKTGAVLQVGHLERFNPVIVELNSVLTTPRFIESTRIAPFKPRGTDVNVVLDLMIHDIDIIQDIVRSPIIRIDSIGAPVFTNEEDIANARIQFENGCVANVTASRISFKSERRMRIFQPDAYIILDFQDKKISVFRKGEGEMSPGVPNVTIDKRDLGHEDVLRAEIESFLRAVAGNEQPVVTGEDGRRALKTALMINNKISMADFAR